MTTSTQSLPARANDVAPTSELGTFEIVRRLPVTTWSLRPNASVPTIASTKETALALHSLGRLAGWLEACDWSATIQARLAARYELAQNISSPRNTTAWLGIASDTRDGIASVPPPPSWLPSILKGWSTAVDCSTVTTHERADFALRAASWTIWLFGITQPYANDSEIIAHAHAARLISIGVGLPATLVAGQASSDTQRTTLARALANALTAEKFSFWHNAWLLEVAAESDRLTAALVRAKKERIRLLECAAEMRAPKNCIELAESLIAKPQTNVADAAVRMGITFRAAQAIVDKFVSQKILREITGRQRDRVFQCDAFSDQMLFASPLDRLQ
ncbi:MAG: hypothetical protein O2875_06355 [Planctomycetota bacterium]|nr:hypothetical protein [Planctomycetota bacterium]MDA1261683.1 hypothetical protein [Planctomycetota bacterium]